MAYHILLVDDAPELRRMVGELLEGAERFKTGEREPENKN